MEVQKYKILKILGDGAFGTVYKATNSKTGEVVAIKKMKQKYTNWNECIELKEIKSLRKLSHPNLIKLKEVLLVSEELYMVFEYLDYNLYDVYSKMRESGKQFTEREIKNIVLQIFSGLASMHKNGFFHRDMKPENLLIYNNVVKICDLGLAREIRSRPPYTDYVSTRWYRAPELLLRSTNYNSPVDVFAMGCIMAELYTLCPLFAGNNEIDQLNKIVKILGTPDRNDWPQGYKLAQAKGYHFPEQKGIALASIIPNASMEAIDLIESMLYYSSRKRPTAAQILKHEYFKGVTVQIAEAPVKEIIFQQSSDGPKLDTHKEDKNLDVFRATKEKFKQTRKQDVLDQNPFKIDKPHQPEADDLDSIIRELEEKNSKKKSKLPLISTRDKFYNNKLIDKKQLRESKTELKHTDYKYIQKEDWRSMMKPEDKYRSEEKKNEEIYKKYAGSVLGPNPSSKKEALAMNKFSYSFQPAVNLPVQPPTKSGMRPSLNIGMGFLPIPKPIAMMKRDLQPLGAYKY